MTESDKLLENVTNSHDDIERQWQDIRFCNDTVSIIVEVEPSDEEENLHAFEVDFVVETENRTGQTPSTAVSDIEDGTEGMFNIDHEIWCFYVVEMVFVR
jgi:hypothetical protein